MKRSGNMGLGSGLLAGLLGAALGLPAAVCAAEQADTERPAAEAKIARGLLLENEGRVFFAPCRERSYLNVSDESPEGAVLQALRAFGLAPGRSLYVELIASVEGGHLRVSALNLARTAARCLGEVKGDEQWRALGLAQDWTAAAGAGVLRVEQLGHAQLHSPYSEIEHAGARRGIVAEQATLTLAPGLCRVHDGSLLSGWQARLQRAAGAESAGCGWAR